MTPSRDSASARGKALVREALVGALNTTDFSRPDRAAIKSINAGVDVPGLVAAAAWHRIDGYVWLTFRNMPQHALGPVALAALADLEKHYLSAVARQLKVMADLRLLVELFDRAAIAFAVIKGPALSGLAYPRPDLRSYQDLDVLVHPAAFGDALTELEKVGGVVLDENWDLLADRHAGEVRVQALSGTMLDLHWSLFNERAVREAFSVGTDAVLARCAREDLGGLAAPVLDPIDALIHVAVHACSSGGNKLGWLKDVELSLYRVDGWPALVERAREWRANIPLATMLARASTTIGTILPGAALANLAPGYWLRIVAVTERLSPLTAMPEDGSLSRLVARSARSDGPATVVELARRGISWAASRPRHTQRSIWDATDRTSAAFASGTRATFLANVARER